MEKSLETNSLEKEFTLSILYKFVSAIVIFLKLLRVSPSNSIEINIAEGRAYAETLEIFETDLQILSIVSSAL